MSVYSRRLRRPMTGGSSRWAKLASTTPVKPVTQSRPATVHEIGKTASINVDKHHQQPDLIHQDPSTLDLDDPLQSRIFFEQLRQLVKSEEPETEQDLLDQQLMNEVQLAVKNINFQVSKAQKPKKKKGPTLSQLKQAADAAKVTDIFLPSIISFLKQQAESSNDPPKKTIAQKRYEAMVQERELEIERLRQRRFKAQDIPESCQGQKLMKILNEYGLKKLSKMREIQLRAAEKRQNEAPQCLATTDPAWMKTVQFKSNPIPKSLFDADVVEVSEEERKRRIKQRKEELLQMLEHHQKHGERESDPPQPTKKTSKKKIEPPEYSFKPQLSKPPPDFQKLQQQFEESLQRRKQELHKKMGVKPELLRSHSSSGFRSKSKDLHESRRPQSAADNKTKVDWSKPPKTTYSTILKKKYQKTKMEEQRQKELEAEQEELDRLERVKRAGQKVKNALHALIVEDEAKKAAQQKSFERGTILKYDDGFVLSIV